MYIYIYIYIYSAITHESVCCICVVFKPIVAHVFLQNCELSFNSFQLNVMCDVTIELAIVIIIMISC